MATSKDVQRKAAAIQQYFNKIGITKIGDLSVSGPETEDDIYAGFGGFKTSFEGFTSVDQSRIQRYREYEQMTYVPELNAGLELYADDATLYNEDDQVIATEADNSDVAETIENLWYRSADMNSNLWHIVYNTCKYGDAFYEVIPDSYEKPQRVKYIRFIPPQFVTREEKDGNLIAFIVKIPPSEGEGQGYSPAGTYTQNTPGFDMSGEGEEVILKPWQIIHFKLDDKEFEPYGKSVLESGRLAFKQMKLIEDAMLIYRISRAPERRIFRIPVGNLPYRDAMNRVEDFKQKYRKTPWVDPTTGEINYKANPLSINDDFFLPTRPDGTGVQIENLPGGQQLGEIDDVRYFKDKILRTMRIPLAYLTGELSGDVAKTSLAAMDVRFAKTIERIQKMIVKGLEKVAIIELAFKRYSIEDLYSFQVMLTTPSKIYEMQELEVLTQKLNVIQTAMGLADENGVLYLPREWLYKNISKFNEQEISNIKLMQQAELAEKQEIQQRAEAGAAGAETAGGGAEPMAGGGELGGAAPELGGGGEEAGGGGAPAPEAEAGGGGEAGAEEAPAEAPAPEAGGGEAGLETASKILSIAGRDFLLENEEDLREVINFVKRERENAKITKDKFEKKRKRKLFENSFNVLFMKGELKGLVRRKNNGNNSMLKD